MYPDIVIKYIEKEILLKHAVGPFDTPPFANFVCSSLGVRPKKTGGARLSMDLSRPFGRSVNDYICAEDYSLRYFSIDDTVRMATGKGSQ